MSATQAATPLSAAANPTIRDNIIADARNLPDLIRQAQRLDPELATRLTGTATAASVTAPGVATVYAVTWLASHYALGWSADTCSLVGGFAVLAGGYVFHRFRHATSLVDTTAKVPS